MAENNNSEKKKKIKVIRISNKDFDVVKLDINPERENIIVIDQHAPAISE